MDHAALQDRLAGIGQSGVLRFYDVLDEAGKARLDAQIAALDTASLPDLIEGYVKNKPKVDLPSDIKPVKAYPHSADTDEYKNAKARGEELLRQGKVAAFLVAGGQGTRLGYEGPKGEYPVTPVKKKPLFQVFAEQLTAVGRAYGKPVPWYIMTSEANDAATRAFFEKHNYFGLDKSLVRFFPQGMMPAFDAKTGDLLLASRDSLALSADGHGGSFRALRNSGALDDMKTRGIEHLSYFQVDNPIIKIIDPLFLGLHDLTGSEMSSKTITKAGPLEKVGNFCVGDGKTQVIEYSDLPESLAKQTDANGQRTFDAGSIAIHALRVSFVDRLTAPGSDLKLIWHRADKKVPFVNDSGETTKPTEPNGVKLEQFVFDAIPLAANALIYTTKREDEFSPVKNAEGNDSPATCTRDQIRLFARWLEAAGVSVPRKPDGEPDAVIEISPLFARNAEELKTKPLQVKQIKPGESVYFG